MERRRGWREVREARETVGIRSREERRRKTEMRGKREAVGESGGGDLESLGGEEDLAG